MRVRGMSFAQRREYRRLMRLLHQLDGADAGLPTPHARARGVVGKFLVTAVVAALVASFAFTIAHKLWGVTLTADGLRIPQPLGRPPEVPQGQGSFSFLQVQPTDADRPVAYDPCRPIEYQVNDALAPAGAATLLEGAVARISHATGLRFDYVGRTDRLPDPDARFFRISREPVLIAWTTPHVVPAVEGRTAGIGGSTARRHELTGDLEYVTGMVALDSPDLHAIWARPDGRAQVRAILLHELGHLVGLGHVADRNELMYDDNAGRLDLGPGDREGLALLGSGSCYH